MNGRWWFTVMNKIAIYGLSTETERLLPKLCNQYEIVGLLDGFRTKGSIYGQRIISLDQAVNLGITKIIVIARPGSCKAISKRIGDICQKENIELYDIRGKNLLLSNAVAYRFTNVEGYTRADIVEQILTHDVISFDLFDTLVMRQVLSYEDVIELTDVNLRKTGIFFEDFSNKRLAAEKELSQGYSPTLSEIYEKSFGNKYEYDWKKLAELEFEIDLENLVARNDMVDLFLLCKESGKEVCITSETYYTKDQIKKILRKCGIVDCDSLFISCEYQKGKNSGLYEYVKEQYHSMMIMHIGDDAYADYQMARESELDAYMVYSARQLLDELGGLDLDKSLVSLSDHIKLGLLLSRLFNSPFQFEKSDKMIEISKAYEIGYLFCAPVINDFVQWFVDKTENFTNIWFSARDGYLIKKLYEKYTEKRSHYFLTSRKAAIRAGVNCREDIEYIDSMKFSGTVKECLKQRFNIELNALEDNSKKDNLLYYENTILRKAKRLKANYQKYISYLQVDESKIAFFDFVAKGTSQMFVSRLIPNEIMGYYFLQLEPEFMSKRGLLIEPFYGEDERSESSIFENYYILETLLTAEHASVDEFDDEGNPVYSEDSRTEESINCVNDMQRGVEQYVDDYINLCPKELRNVNKPFDEIILELLHKVKICDNIFLQLRIEDPFFNRMTDITDVL